MSKTIVQWEEEDIGIEHSQYFVGRGTMFTKWDHVSVGIGDNAYEAFEDAAEMLAQMGFDNVDGLENPFNPSDDHSAELGYEHDSNCPLSDNYITMDEDFDPDTAECECDYSEDSELHYHVAIWVREADGFEPRKGDDLSIRSKEGDREVIGHTFVDQVHEIGMKYGKPFWRVEDHIGRHFFAHDPFVMDDGELSWVADEYDYKVYKKMAKDMGIAVKES